MTITYKLNGRIVSQKQFFEGIEGQVRQLALDGVIERLKSVTCTEHGKHAEVGEINETSQGFSFRLTGCCQDLIDRAQKTLS